MPNPDPFLPSRQIERRQFLKLSSLAVVGLGLSQLSEQASGDPATPPPPIDAPKSPKLKATFGEPIAYKNLHGDSWAPTWADDDNLYSIADDTKGLKAAPIDSNLAVYKIAGGPPPNIQVEAVNPMPSFGKCTEVKPEDNCCWKATGLTCIDGALYLSASRHRYAIIPETWHIQQSSDASIIKSTDHGKTWSPTPLLGKAMFPGHGFANPSFVQYGKDGRGAKDGADTYVYAMSNDGTWNNGNSTILGRVRRERLGDLNAADWEFVHDFDSHHNPVWQPRYDNAAYTFRGPGRTGMAGVHYIRGLDLYIMPQWHYPSLNQSPQVVAWNRSRFELYQAPAPWGPWTLFHTQDYDPQGFYNPTIPSKFISEDGRSLWLFTAGDFSTNDHPYYTINMIPVTLEVGAV